ncbi:MAG: hypothetical protein QOK20_3279 [Acidimicrobiaceae bacterium]|jgi:hypothetical protein|nr:hypothetical protein [Acidimicrobiaceae bacterium]
MRAFEPLMGRRPRRTRRTGIAAASTKVLGVPVHAALPLQRHNPSLVLAMSVAVLGAFVFFVATATLGSLALLVALSLLLVVVTATNRRQVLAFTSQGHVALSASLRGRPQAPIGPVPRRLPLPEPSGLGQPIQVGDTRWWVDRSAFERLRHARALLEADREDDGGEGEDHGRQDGDAVEVALDHRRAGRRRSESPAEHLGESAAPPAVQEDEHDQAE